jgi:hypothetical protein
MREAAGDKRAVALNFTLMQALIDWSFKLVPIIGFAIQFYMSQDRTQDRSKQNESHIVKLETEINELKRTLTDTQAEQRVQKQQMQDQKEFYGLTHAGK